jgi:ketosteroid isomerase-like protein
MRHATCATFVLMLIATMNAALADETREALAQQVRDAESAFAASMAARDVDAFASYVSEEAVFFGGTASLRGRDAVVAGWRRFFEGEPAPFSWSPEVVEVLDSGALAHSSGPVRSPDGKVVGTFNSIWRREGDGRWRVVFDKGCDVCACNADTR